MNNVLYLLVLTLLVGIMMGILFFAFFIRPHLIEERTVIKYVLQNSSCGSAKAYYADNYSNAIINTTVQVYTR